MTVELRNPEYEKFIQEWQSIQDCCDGQRAIKEKNIRYLRPMEGVSSIDNRYRNYLHRAVFVNFTGKTREGLTGAIFRNSPDFELPSQTEYLEKNADGAGESLVSLAKDVTGEVIAKGRHALLVDYPQVTQGLSLEELNELSPKATINRYTCENFINWRVEVINGQKLLTLAVLQETYDMNDDEFEYEEGKQYRVLRLRNGVYTQQLYQELDPITEEYIPRKSDGEPFDFIPLFIIGSENNDTTVDIPPLGDIANINLAHYRNSADLEENCFVHGQLTLGVSSSMSLAQFQEAKPEGIMVGSMAGHFLGESGGFSFVQASENQLADKLMERKEDQMRKLGARMISLTATKPATQSLIEAAGEWCGMFMGATNMPKFALSTKFFDEVADPQMLMAAMQLNEAGILAKSDMQNLARSQGVVNELRLNEEIDADIEQENAPQETENQEIAPNEQNPLTREEDDDI